MQENPSYLELNTLRPDIKKRVDENGICYLVSNVALEEHPKRTTTRFCQWANNTPERLFLAQKDGNGKWASITYGEALEKIQNIGQYLLTSGVSVEKPIAILSGNSIEHGLIALAALHVGIPYSAISPAYSLKSSDLHTLDHCIRLLTPGLIFVQDGLLYSKALHKVGDNILTVAVTNLGSNHIAFDRLLNCPATDGVAKAHDQISATSLAKILFTSGSTGMPKGVMNTHGNLTANLQQITQTFPFMANGGLTLIDWLPWNHTFGGNHNFGLVHYNGGSLYIDAGDPTPAGFRTTEQNLKEIAPTVYFNVPKGFEQLVGALRNDVALGKHFFSRLKMLFYAGASMPQHVWDGLEEMCVKTTGKLLLISSGLGMTEASPSAMFNTAPGHESGRLGVPVPGLEIKLVHVADALEARFRGPNLTPGYWRDPRQTKKAFDEAGYYKTGDALKFVDPNNPNAGLVFNGRVAENFKLSSGTWVNTGALKGKLIAAGNGLIKDAVLTGHDNDFIGALVFLDHQNCGKLLGKPTILPYDLFSLPIRQALQHILNTLGEQATGSSTLIKKILIVDFEPTVANGELTDKGSINQRAVLNNRSLAVKKIYAQGLPQGVIECENLKN